MARSKGFDYQGALDAGYSDQEISSFLSDQHPDFDFESATSEGYSPEEIVEFLYQKPEKSTGNNIARKAGQFGLGVAEGLALPYEIAVAPLASKEAQNVAYREGVGEDIERLYEQRAMGIWDEKDQELLDSLTKQIQDVDESEKFVQTADLGIQGLAEKATGLDLSPEDLLEKGARFSGFIKNPKNLATLAKSGLTSKEAIKSILPTGSEALRGLGAGAGLQIAEDGEYGPIGTMAALVVGDLMGSGVAGGLKGGKALVTKPKETLAEVASKFTSSDKKSLQQEIIRDFRNSGLQADLGTLTDNNLVKWTQSRLAQSGLTGKALDDFRRQLTGQIREEYKTLANELGEAKFATTHEAGEVAKEGIKKIRETDLQATRELYKNANEAIKEGAFVPSERLAKSITKLEKELQPGALKSSEQSSVLSTLDKIKRDLYDSEGNLFYAKVKDLMNNKIALNDIINYEVQGGSKQLLKGIVAEIDRAIISHGKENPSFAKNYVNANKKFSEHAKTFRNKNVEQFLRTADPAQIMSKMNSIQGIRDLDKILSKTQEGRNISKSLKRQKLEQVVGNNLVDSSTQQVKLGTFSKLLEKGKNRDVIREILGPKSFKQLERLQKNAGKLADSANKFYNASQSGVVATDAALIYQGVSSLANLLVGNPWPLMKVAGGIMGARKLSGLLADPEFLKLVEEAILASEKNSEFQMVQAFLKLRPYILPVIQESQEGGQFVD